MRPADTAPGGAEDLIPYRYEGQNMQWWEQLDAPILGRYRIERLLGEGGMARVFLATDVRAGRPVAFKTPKIEEFPPASVKELLSRFNREFRSQASDPIQGVIPIYESGEFTDPDGVVRPFLAMQYLSGGSLGDLLGGDIGRRAHRQTLGEVLEWLVPIARTVDRLHARKYLHRDIKPDNILFNSDGDPFLADLGIVGSLDNTLGGSTMAATGLGVLGSPGSPGYQSPESMQADASLRNISASDQFSLAVTVYEALAGRLPVDAGTNQQWYGALMHWSPTPLSTYCPDMPQAASDAVMKAMSTQASGRFLSCSEFARACLESGTGRAGRQEKPGSAQVSPPEPDAAERPVSRDGRRVVATRRYLAVAAVLATLGVGYWVLHDRYPGAPREGNIEQAEGGSSALGNATAVHVDCSDLDGDGDLVSDCEDDCKHTPSIAKVDDVGCTRQPEDPNVSSVAFNAGQVEISPQHLKVLDAAVARMVVDPLLQVNLFGNADESEGNTDQVHLASWRRAQSAYEYMTSRGIAPNRISVIANDAGYDLGKSFNEDGSRNAAGIARGRHLDLVIERGKVPELLPAMPVVPSVSQSGGPWTVCHIRASGSGPNSYYYSVSAPMNVGAVPDWKERLRTERPFLPALKANLARFQNTEGVLCNDFLESAERAREFADRQTSALLAEARAKQLNVTKIREPWRLWGTSR